MTSRSDQEALGRLLDRAEILDVLALYARGVDRSDWALVRSTYHPDAFDDHGGFKGGVDALMGWLDDRFADAVGGMHFLGQSVVEFAGPDLALVETLFVSHRVGPAEADGQAQCRQSWGRYVDRFERRGGAWKVARRTVVLDSVITAPVRSAPRVGAAVWGRRDSQDQIYLARAGMLGPDGE